MTIQTGNNEALVKAIRTNDRKAIRNSMLKGNGTLRERDFEEIDREMVDVARQRVGIVPLLISRGLTKMVRLGTSQATYEKKNDQNVIHTDLKPNASSTQNKQAVKKATVDVPFIWGEWEYDIAEDAAYASYSGGPSIDTQAVYDLTYNIMLLQDEYAVNGWDGGVNPMYGLLNQPNGIDVTLTADEQGALNGTRTPTGSQIPNGVLAKQAMLKFQKALYAKNFYTNLVIGVPNNAWANMGDDYDPNNGTDKSILQKLMDLPGVVAVIPVDRLPDSQFVMFQATKDCVDICVGLDLTPFAWENHPLFTNNLIVTKWGIRWKENYNDDVAIARNVVI